MIIDNEKFVALLVENSGLEKEKVEGYLEELINEIKAAIDENEGYEIDGFGIFSKLGANVLFIPSEELETEINYKYAGMEPIELPGSAIEQPPADETTSDEEENPIQGILDGGIAKEEEDEDAFAALFNEEEESEDPISDETDPLDERDIEAVVEEEIQYEETEEAEKIEPTEAEDADIFTEDDSDEQVEDTFDHETEEEENIEEEAPSPDSWGIDAHKEDDQEDAFAGLLGEDAAEDSELLEDDDIFLNEEENAEEPSNEEGEEEIEFSALENDTTESEGFEDPFMGLEDEEQEAEEDFVPIVTNVSSETTSKQEETKEEEEDKSKAIPLKKSQSKKKGTPVFLYMILVLVVLAGSGYLAAYFGIINIKGITPNNNNTQVTQINTPVNLPKQVEVQTALPVKEPANEVVEDDRSAQETSDNSIKTINPAATNADVSEEVATNKEDAAPLITDEKSSSVGGIISPVNIQADAKPYGLTGTATEAGNNGYTIVLYTLSRKAGANKQFETLSRNGYRVIIKENPSERYGALYRVSIGQFKSLADAAIAAEKVDSKTLGNYIITKI